MNRRRFAGTLVGAPAALALTLPVLAHAVRPLPAPALLAGRQAGPIHGIDPADMDLSADPRHDFYRYANGGWLDRVTIPADRSRYGVFAEIDDRTTGQLLGLLENLAGDSALEPGSDEWKAVQLFTQGMDVETRNAQGLDPIRGTLDDIQAIEDLDGLHDFFVDGAWRGVSDLFNLYVSPGMQESSINALYLAGPPLALPNRDYYLDESESYEVARQAFVEACTRLLIIAGYDDAAANESAQGILAFEQELATEILSREEAQDFEVIYNPMSAAELEATYPLMDWQAHFEALGLRDVDEIIVTELRYLQALEDILQRTPISVIRDWLTAATIWAFASHLSEEIEGVIFAFAQVLSGVPEQESLDKRVLGDVSGAMQDAVGKLYVAAYFPPEAKQRITELVESLIVAFRNRLDQNDWMTSTTLERAKEKLDTFGIKVGYPDTWKTYEDVEIGESYAASMISAWQSEMRRSLGTYGEPVDPDEWEMPVQMVNAFYNFQGNEIVFPAGILQAPFFDHESDPASNFGAVGYVIGHEITHGFDQGGSQFDADGNLTNWWAEEDFDAFDALNKRVVEQYSAIEVLPGVFINGQITIGENVADLGGVQTALDALGMHLARHGRSLDDVVHGPLTEIAATPEASPVAAYATPAASPAVAQAEASPEAAENVEAMTQRERFFVAAAMAWREKIRDEALVTQVQTDTHSPAEIRATQPARNMDAYHETFGIEPGDAMYLAPEDRIVIW